MSPPLRTNYIIQYKSLLNPSVCSACLRSLQCQWYRRHASTFAQILNSEDPKPDERDLKPLSRPIGVPHPPQRGENSGIDTRSWSEKRKDSFDYDKHLVRRKELIKQAAKPYFRDWSRVNHHNGKTFLAPSRIFRADKSLYFPNMVGSTLASPAESSDTTPVFQDRVSIVSVQSGRWAQLQTETFVDAKQHPQLATLLAEDEKRGGPLQRVEVNFEESWMKALIVRMFMGGIRKQRREEEWAKYFLVRRGITDDLRQAIGMSNARVGYVYLVDWMCRIRWAGSANAETGEREDLIAGAKRLVEAWRKESEEKTIAKEKGKIKATMSHDLTRR
ncbi:MAG: hypothetical protein Q9194_003391 [Teloschistes cf. exilis]